MIEILETIWWGSCALVSLGLLINAIAGSWNR